MAGRGLAAIAAVLLLALPVGALAADGETAAALAQIQANLDFVWTLTAAALVFLMQVGFLLLEAGLVRSKNSISVAQKNVADFVITTAAFYLFGFGLMFGSSTGWGFGGDHFAWNSAEDWTFAFFVFQVVFCGTAATIVSGAVAERMRFSGYLITTLVLATVIYPIYGHWAWGNLLIGDNPAFLADAGFIDFAGSTVVHSVGGWVALAAIIVIGPRLGRFDANGKPVFIHGHSPVLATAGALLLWIGWIGFNGGSTTVGSGGIAHIIFNTMLAGAFGGVATMLLGRLEDGIFRPDRSINGILGGLVGITAGCDVVATWGAVVIGLTAGIVAFYAAKLLERTFKLDDAVGAVSVHGFAGAWGTLALALVAPIEAFGGVGRLEQFLVQLQGVALAFVWAFGISYLFFRFWHGSFGLRVSQDHELSGLNVAEHGVRLGFDRLNQAMSQLSEGALELKYRLEVDHGEEAGEVGARFNAYLDNLEILLRGTGQWTRVLGRHAEELATTAKEVADQVARVSTETGTAEQATHRIAETTQRAAAAVETAGREAADIRAGAETMSANVHDVASRVADITQALGQIAADAHQADQVVDTAASHSRDVAAVIERLDQQAEAAVAATQLIRDIAAQTNMLALNATIEANRAGAAGRGFAVVAEEVKRLAHQAAEASGEIEQRLDGMRGGATEAVNAITAMGETMGGVHDVVGRITGHVETQSASAHALATAMDEAAGAADRVTASIATLADNVHHAAENTSAVAGEIATVGDSIENVHAAAAHSSDLAEGLRTVADRLLQIATQIREALTHLGAAEEQGHALMAAVGQE